MKVLHFLLSAFLCADAASLGRRCDQPVALTSNGPIIGHKAANFSSVAEYLGIPYAQPPVGPLRFAEPQRYTKNSTFVASQFSPNCPQKESGYLSYPDETPQFHRIATTFSSGLNQTQSEDCLTLNVWDSVSSPGPKPVIVLFYGGRFANGETDTPFYNGARLAAAEPVVVVTLNYRINIFGFPGAPGITQNVGLLDQRLAVEWVRDNIHAFGGDATRITILGQSAGAVSVDYWAYNYPSDPIVAGLISHSGNALSFGSNTASVAAAKWYNVSAALGCGSSGSVLSCMRAQPFSALASLAGSIAGGAENATTLLPRTLSPFQPTIDNLTVYSDATYIAKARRGHFARLPYLVGNNDNEAGWYRIASYGKTGNTTALPDAVWTDFNLESFTCPTAFAGATRARHGVPVWLFRYCADWPNLRLYPSSGAYHGVDLNMVFGNGEVVAGLADAVAEREMERLMMRGWAAFAAEPAEGLRDVMGWETYDPDEPTLIRLGYNNSPTAELIAPRVYDSSCSSLSLSYWDN
ncbi:carboxylesterase [Saccharata proteae CBS 121410]|uniref:Carboxylic ester hydrolase n=1 Tax=Saccharata proteae CBS 121410 TaxID=1314787 RepID=A0A6A5YE12_9PEZI|nr:carboxylesterase [Saccharata proteae CBS 121410]